MDKKIYKVQFLTNSILKNKILKNHFRKKFKTKQIAIKIMMIKFGKKNNRQPLFYIRERVRHDIDEKIEKREEEKEKKYFEPSKLHRSSSCFR
jgi:hypothetical protein